MQNDTYYGAPTNSQIKMIRERLREKYDPEDFVTVINVDTRPVTYQVASPNDIETYSSGPADKNTVMKRPPQRYTLQPGDTKLVPAYEADMMIETLIKQIAMNRLETRLENGEINRNPSGNTADWTDPFFQETLINQIFVGKKDILGDYNMQAAQPTAAVEKDLDINEPRPVGRPRKEV